tara:strand:+ start:3589 stop:3981 length:393 start_codon:yes stop_codon:yes gene_type:complete
MKIELFYLALVSAFTAILWLPYARDRIISCGLIYTVGYSKELKPQSLWAQRMMNAHKNAIENLVIFAALVLVAHAAEITSSTIATACVVYFWARILHAVVYTLGIPWVRTLAFATGFFAQAVIAWQILFS